MKHLKGKHKMKMSLQETENNYNNDDIFHKKLRQLLL